MLVRDLQQRAFATAEAHGFWDDWHALGDSEHRDRGLRLVVNEKLALIHSELSEALEEVRDAGDDFDRLRGIRYRESDGKPEGFAVELADAIVRIGDLADALGVDLTRALEEKMAFNETRPHKHGRGC